MQQLTLDLLAASPASLENFTVGPNQELMAYLRQLLDGPCPISMCPIYLWGDQGSGKTHLLQALQARGLRVIDDVHLLDAKGQDTLFSAIQSARANGTAIIAAGPVPPLALALREDVRTRLGWGLILELHALSDEQKAAALQQLAQQRGLGTSPELISYMLTRTQRDMRALTMLIEQLDQYCLANKRALTIPLLRQYLAQRYASVE